MGEDWTISTLGEVFNIVSGSTPKGLMDVSNLGNIPFYKVSDMNSEGNEVHMTKANIYLNQVELENLRIKCYPKGTVIFPKRGGAILTNKKRVLSQSSSFDLNLMGVLPEKYIYDKWMYYWFQALDLNKIYDGSNVPQINNKNILPLKFQLAPLPIQRAIVAKIEELFSSLDSGVTDLKKALEQLHLYKHAVLKQIFEINNSDFNFLRKPISSIGEIVTGSTPSKNKFNYYSSYDYNFYKPTDLNAGKNVEKTKDFLSSEGFEAARTVPANSILVTCIGATIGKTGLVKKEGGFNQQINAIIPSIEYNPLFVYYQALSIDFQSQIKSKSSSTTLPILNKTKFSKLEMNTCPISEQVRIVQEIESKFSICENLEELLIESVKKSYAVRQSILKKAFEGKLLPMFKIKNCKMESDYEPASVLLEKIKAEKKKK